MPASQASLEDMLRQAIERIRAGLEAPEDAAPSDAELHARMERVGDLFLAMIGDGAPPEPLPPPEPAS